MVHFDYTVGCDPHRRFLIFAILDSDGTLLQQRRVGRAPGTISAFLSQFPEGTPVALETIGNWYWIVNEIEEAGPFPCWPTLPRPRS